jgi:hypothetical protein
MDVDAWVKGFLQEMDAIHGVPSNEHRHLRSAEYFPYLFYRLPLKLVKFVQAEMARKNLDAGTNMYYDCRIYNYNSCAEAR